MYSVIFEPNKYLLRMNLKEDILPTFKTFCELNNIFNGTFAAIGSIENPILAHYRVNTKKYTETKFTGVFEIVSLIGNIANSEKGIIIHPHISISDDQMHSYGGHLVSGFVSATLEITISSYPSKFNKAFDESVGLNLWDIADSDNK